MRGICGCLPRGCASRDYVPRGTLYGILLPFIYATPSRIPCHCPGYEPIGDDMKIFTRFQPSPPLWVLLALFSTLFSSCENRPDSDFLGAGLVIVAPAHAPETPEELSKHDHDHAPSDGSEQVGRPYFHDFGTVPDGEVVSTTFQLTNTDRLPVTITRMDPSCGCTVPSVHYFDEDGHTVVGHPSNEPEILVIPPLARVELTVRIDTNSIKNKNIQKLLQIRVTTDSRNDPYLTFECSLMVEQPFRIAGEFLSLGKLPKSVGGSASAELSQTGPSHARLTGVGATPPGVEAVLTQQPILGREIWDLQVTVSPPLETGNYANQIELLAESANGEPHASWFVDLRGTIVPDIDVNPSRVIFESSKDDEARFAQTELRMRIPGARFTIVGVEVQGAEKDWIEVEWTAVPEPRALSSASWKITAKASPTIRDGQFAGTLTVITDDSQNPRITIPYAGI